MIDEARAAEFLRLVADCPGESLTRLRRRMSPPLTVQTVKSWKASLPGFRAAYEAATADRRSADAAGEAAHTEEWDYFLARYRDTMDRLEALRLTRERFPELARTTMTVQNLNRRIHRGSERYDASFAEAYRTIHEVAVASKIVAIDEHMSAVATGDARDRVQAARLYLEGNDPRHKRGPMVQINNTPTVSLLITQESRDLVRETLLGIAAAERRMLPEPSPVVTLEPVTALAEELA